MPAVLIPLAGLALGATAMFMLDPVQGRRRRALLRDQIRSRSRKARGFAEVASHDIGHRSRGLIAEVRALLQRRGPVSDKLVVHRVRAKIGRFVSHPHAIEVSATHGRITLRGPVLAAEHANLLKSIATVHGVTNVDDRLSIHESAEGISALQGGDPPAGQPMEFMQRSWSPAARTLSGGAGGALMLYSLAKRGPLGAVALATGAAMLVRAATNRPFSELSRRRPVKHGYAPEQIPSQLTERAAGPEV